MKRSKESKAAYLITGDKDLLEIKKYGQTEIIDVTEFSKRMDKAKPKSVTMASVSTRN